VDAFCLAAQVEGVNIKLLVIDMGTDTVLSYVLLICRNRYAVHGVISLCPREPKRHRKSLAAYVCVYN